MDATASLARNIDHVAIVSDDAASLHSYCCHDLGLPAAWEFGTYGTVRSGGVTLGDLNLELLDSGSFAAQGRGIRLVALHPNLEPDALVKALDAAGTWHTEPLIVRGEIGFTNVVVPPFVTEMTFFCTYHDPAFQDSEQRRSSLRAHDGGRLGLRAVTEVRANVDVATAAPVLGPGRGDRWTFDDGPALVIDASVEVGGAVLTCVVDRDDLELPPELGDIRLTSST